MICDADASAMEAVPAPTVPSMKFSELPLYQAIRQAHDIAESPRSNKWLISQTRELYMLIVNYMPDFENGVPYTRQQVAEAWEKFGKSPSAGGYNKYRLTVDVANAHGEHCFYANRGLGPCDDEIELERLIPAARNGTYCLENCVISCRAHNNARRDEDLEAFLLRRIAMKTEADSAAGFFAGDRA